MQYKISFILLFCLAFLICPYDISSAAPDESTIDDISYEFQIAYEEWYEYCQTPPPGYCCSSESYIDNIYFERIVEMGEPALPLIMDKIREGYRTGWEEGNFFLWYSVRDITGVDLSEGIDSEQEIALRYLEWWESY